MTSRDNNTVKKRDDINFIDKYFQHEAIKICKFF